MDFHDSMALDDATEAAQACCECSKDLAGDMRKKLPNELRGLVAWTLA